MAEIRSLARGLQILDLLGDSRDDVGVTELGGLLGVDKASASRLVATLAHHGYLEQNPATRRYHLGPRLLALRRARLSQLTLPEVAGPFLRSLMVRSGECAHLGVASQGRVLYLGQAESPATLRVNVQVGQTAPLHCTALGKALLAFGAFEFPHVLEPFTPHTLTDRNRLARALAATHHQGYAVDDEEFELDVRCVAAPVYDDRSSVIAAVGISGPTTRLTDRRLPGLARIVMQIAGELSERLGCTQR